MKVDFIDKTLDGKGKRVFYLDRHRVDELLNMDTPTIVAIKHYRDLGGDLGKVAIYTETDRHVLKDINGYENVIETHSVREKEMR